MRNLEFASSSLNRRANLDAGFNDAATVFPLLMFSFGLLGNGDSHDCASSRVIGSIIGSSNTRSSDMRPTWPSRYRQARN